MRGKAFLLTVCVTSILLLQATGLHLHVGAADSASLHGEHQHHADPDGHDHADDSDVTINDIGAAWGKILVHLLPLLVLFVLAPEASQRWSPAICQSLRPRRSRWRPPLRAPPSG